MKLIILLLISLLFVGVVHAQQIPQLTYTDIGTPSNSETITLDSFTAQMSYLNSSGWKSITFQQYYNWIDKNTSIPKKSFIIALEDGNMQDITLFKPVMDKYGFVGTSDIVTNWVGLGGQLSWSNITTLKNSGWEITSHGTDHKDLMTMNMANRTSEYALSQSIIFNRTGYLPLTFIYPYNDQNSSLRKECMQYYRGCSGDSSYASSIADKYLNETTDMIKTGLVRVKVENSTDINRFIRIFSAITIPDPLNLSNVVLDGSLNCSARVNKLSNVSINFYLNGLLNVTYFFSANGSFSITAANATGTWYCNVTARDGLTNTSHVSNIIFINNTVIPINIAPVVIVSNQSLTDFDGDGYENVTLDGSASYDPDGNISAYNWLENNSSIGNASIVILPFSVGMHYLQLLVTDDDNATNTGNFTVNISQYIPLVADAGMDFNVTDMDEDGYESAVLNGTASSDSDGIITDYSWYDNFSLIANDVAPYVNLTVGTHLITLFVTDNNSMIANDSVIVTVLPKPDIAPIADAGMDFNVTDSDGNGYETVVLNGSNSYDPDGNITSFAWYDNLTLIGSGIYPIINLSIGSHLITLMVTDDVNATGFDYVNVTIFPKPNIPPYADAGIDFNVTDINGDGFEPAVLNATKSFDTDGNITSFVWFEGLNQIGAGIYAFTNLSVGNHLITLFVTDNSGATANDSVNVTIFTRPLNPPYADLNTPIVQLTYHDISNNYSQGYAYSDNVTNFAAQMKLLNDSGICPITLDQYWAFRNNETRICNKSVIIVFDDGLESQYLYAKPILDQYGFKANFAIITKNVANGTIYDSMSIGQLQTLASQGYDILSHSVNHLFMPNFDEANQTYEYAASRNWLTNNVGVTPKYFIYPNNAENTSMILDCEKYYLDCSGDSSYEYSGGNLYMHGNDPLSRGMVRVSTDDINSHNITDYTQLFPKGWIIIKTTIPNVPPIADSGKDYNVTDINNDGYDTVVLNGSKSFDPDGNITSFVWFEGLTQVGVGVTPFVNLSVSSHFITLIVTDNSNGTSNDSVNIVVLPYINIPPVADAGIDFNVTDFNNDGFETVTLNASKSYDIDGNITAFAWFENLTPVGIGIYPTINLSVGYHLITLFVTDNLNASSNDSIVVNVVPYVNIVPLADAGVDFNVSDINNDGFENVALNGSKSFDPDGNITNYYWIENLTLIGTGIYPVVNLSVGSHLITLIVTDNSNSSSNDSVNIVVLPYINIPPVADAGFDINVTDSNNDGFETVVLNGSASSDINGVITDYSWYENQTLLAVGVTAIVNLSVATHMINLIIVDNQNISVNDSVIVTVLPKSDILPIADAGIDFNVTDNDSNGYETIVLNATNSFDPDGNITSYVWSEGLNQIGVGVTPIVNLSVGYHLITLIVTDNSNTSANDSVVVIVLPANIANIPPVADAGVDINVADSNNDGKETVALNGSKSFDSDGNITSYVWFENVTFVGTGIYPVMNLSIGTHLITLIVTDNSNTSSNDSVIVKVLSYVNILPHADAGPDINVTDLDNNGKETITLNASISYDPDGNITSYVWFDNLSMLGVGIRPSINLTVGTHVITLFVTDNLNASSNDSIIVKVLPYVNVLPVADAGLDINITDLNNNGKETITLNATKSYDPDGTITKYAWYENSVLLSSQKVVSRSFTTGVHNVTLIVTDNKNATTQDTVFVIINKRSLIILNGTSIHSNNNLITTLNWTGALTTVNLYRNGAVIKTLNNTGSYTDTVAISRSTSVKYKICDQYICSNTITMK